jgi:hypothetical protein
MSGAHGAVLAALVTGAFSLSGTAITATTQLIARDDQPAAAALAKAAQGEGLCVRLVERLLALRVTRPEIVAAARAGPDALPPLYSGEEVAACGYDAAKVARMLVSAK